MQCGGNPGTFVLAFIRYAFVYRTQGVVLGSDGSVCFVETPPVNEGLSRKNDGREEAGHAGEPKSNVCLRKENPKESKAQIYRDKGCSRTESHLSNDLGHRATVEK